MKVNAVEGEKARMASVERHIHAYAATLAGPMTTELDDGLLSASEFGVGGLPFCRLAAIIDDVVAADGGDMAGFGDGW